MAVVPCGRPSELRSRTGGPTAQKTLWPKLQQCGWIPGFPWVGPVGTSHAGEGGGGQEPQQCAWDKASTSIPGNSQNRLDQRTLGWESPGEKPMQTPHFIVDETEGC